MLDSENAHPMPWWVRAIAIIGIPGVLVIYLVYIGAQELPGLRRGIDINNTETLRNREMQQQIIERLDAAYRMQQRICSNTAATDEERNRCFDK